MTIRFYGYDGCSTCKKALKFLSAHAAKAKTEVLDITVTPPTARELKAMLALYDGNVRKLFNTSGVVYREQKVGAQLAAGELDDAAALKLLASNGRLVKRPFLIVDGEPAGVGFDETHWEKVLNGPA